MNDLKSRYLNDPIFHTIVNHIRAIITSATLTPSEVREAAMVACVIDEQYKPRRPFTTSDADLEIVRQSLERRPPAARDPFARQDQPNTDGYRSPFGGDLDAEAFRLLDLINAEFSTDPKSVQCFDLRIVERVRRCVEQRRRAEHQGDVPPLLTAPTEPADGFHR